MNTNACNLRKLAEINGTLRDNNWQAPPKIHNIQVECSICGEVSHPTSDCPFKGQPGIKHKMDLEYENFMAEIGGGVAAEQAVAGQLGKVDVEKSYEEFMASISGTTNPTNPAQAANPWSTPQNPWAQQGWGAPSNSFPWQQK